MITENDKPAGFISGTDPDGTTWEMPYWLPGPAGGGRRDAVVEDWLVRKETAADAGGHPKPQET